MIRNETFALVTPGSGGSIAIPSRRVFLTATLELVAHRRYNNWTGPRWAGRLPTSG